MKKISRINKTQEFKFSYRDLIQRSPLGAGQGLVLFFGGLLAKSAWALHQEAGLVAGGALAAHKVQSSHALADTEQQQTQDDQAAASQTNPVMATSELPGAVEQSDTETNNLQAADRGLGPADGEDVKLAALDTAHRDGTGARPDMSTSQLTVDLSDLTLGTPGHLPTVQAPVMPEFVAPSPAFAIEGEGPESYLKWLGLMVGGGTAGQWADFAAGVVSTATSTSSIAGYVADGYIENAIVFRTAADQTNSSYHIPINGTYYWVEGGTSGLRYTSSTGSYTALPTTGGAINVLASTTSIDISTGESFTSALTLSAPSGYGSVINPITTLIQDYVETYGVSSTAAASLVATSFGISSSYNLLTLDPIAQYSATSGSTQTAMLSIQKSAAQIANLMITGTQAVLAQDSSLDTATTSKAVLASLTSAMHTAGGTTTLDLSDSTTLDSMLSSVTVGTTTVNTSSTARAAIASANGQTVTSLENLYLLQKEVQGNSEYSDAAFASLTKSVASAATGEVSLAVSFSNSSDGGSSGGKLTSFVADPTIKVDLTSLKSHAFNASTDKLVVSVFDGSASKDNFVTVTSADYAAGYKTVALSSLTSGLTVANLDALIVKAEFGPTTAPLGAGYLAFTMNTAKVDGAGVTAGLITESNAIQSTSGQLPATIDSTAVTYTAATQSGTYGSLVMTATGAWKYTMGTAHNELVGGTTYTDSFSVTASNGAVDTVTVSLQGTNDTAVIGGTTAKTTTETDLAQTITGTLTVKDVDSAAAFFPQDSVAGSKGYGKFTLDTLGNWTYLMDTPHDEFKAGTTYTDTVTATTVDGTTQTITVKIVGAAETIGGVSSADLTETNAVQSTSGALTAGSGLVVFNAFASKVGTGGYGAFGMDSAGNWTYTMGSAHNEFAYGTSYTDYTTVSSTDGTTQRLTVTMLGSNDSAVIAGTTSASLTETNVVQTVSGQLSVTDVDNAATIIAQTDAAGGSAYGTFSIDSAGKWTYTMGSAHNEFVAGTTYTDTLTVTSADGTPQVLTVSILGTNDAAVFTGDKTSTLTETNEAQSATGTLLASDSDSSNAIVAQSSVAGSYGYGTFTLDAYGAWTYTMNSAHNEFVAGKTYTDSLTAKTADGTSQTVTVSIVGTNDAAVVGGTTSGAITETNGIQTATGALTVTDVDSALSFVAQSGVAGSNGYGTFSLTTVGAWTYTMNTAHNEFVADITYTDSLTARTADGTSQLVTVSIAGTNDAATFGGTSTATLTETNAEQTSTGNITASDVDSPSTFIAQTGITGSSGYGTFSLTSAGAWTYTMSTAHNEFVKDVSYTDSMTAVTADGTTKTVTVTIVGTNDSATISGDTTASLTQSDSALTTTGKLIASDVDSSTLFAAQTAVDGSNLYGKFSIAADGTWTYAMNTAHPEFVKDTTYTDSFTAVTADGTKQLVTVSMLGVNDAAVIAGDTSKTIATTYSDTTNHLINSATAQGMLSITDPDSPATFFPQSCTSGENGYGTFTLTSAGKWTYSMGAQQLDPGASLTDNFTVSSADGTSSVVTVTIKTPGEDTASLTETDSAQTATGTLSAGTYTAIAAGTAGSKGYGTFELSASGAWIYTMNSAHDEFKKDQTYTDTISAVNGDNTTTTVTVNITGTNDAAVISGTKTIDLTETDAILTTSGTLTSTDVDGAANPFRAETVSGTYGSLSMTSTGAWSYSALSAQNQLATGAKATDSFVVRAGDGTASTISVTINGTNDAAVVGGSTSASLTETNVVQTATGKMTVSDVDSAASFIPQSAVAGSNGYGTFTLSADGSWTYTMGSAHNEFRDGVTYTDTLTAKTADGTSQAVTVSMLGTNDAAVVRGTSTASITETNNVQSASGTLLVSDVDSTASFVAQPSTVGNYGTFSLTSSGAWAYQMSTAHNEFVKDVSYTDSMIAVTADGTTKLVVVTLTGTNDPAVISAPVKTVDETNAPIAATGTLTITDTDSPLTFVAQKKAGTYGTFNLTSAGLWTYTASSAYDYLNVGNTLTDTFSVASYDGTTSSVTVKIAGTNDAPVMSASAASFTLKQGAAAQTIATVSATDIDPVGTLSYSISRKDGDASLDYFSVDKATGALNFLAPAALSSAVDAVDLYNNTTGALGADGYMDSPYKIHVIATDAYGAYSTSEEIKVNIKMAVASSGLSAELPSTSSYWTFAPQTTSSGDGDGFLMTSTSDSNIYIHLLSTTSSLTFVGDGSTFTLSNDKSSGSLSAVIQDLSATTGHNVTISAGTIEDTTVKVLAASTQTITGASDTSVDPDLGTATNYRSDTLEITDALFANAKFAMSGNLLTVTTGTGVKTLSDVEAVHFTNGDTTVRVVGASGYASFKEALDLNDTNLHTNTSHANVGDYIYGSSAKGYTPTASDLTHLTAVSGLTDFYTYHA